jgi:glyoxylase-like metal-dependent hydrolase (beta-lactamase superfamily II)
MKMWKTNQKNEIFQVLSGRTNCYLIPTDDGNILVDTGVRSAYDSLRKHIRSMHLVNERIDKLVLTHTHFDHCRNAAAIKEEDGCQVIVGKEEAGFVEGGNTPLPRGTFSFSRFLVHLGNKLPAGRFAYDPFQADILVDQLHHLVERQDIRIDLISTPGHSAGSISLIVDDDVAMVGDVMIGVFSNSIFPPFADDISLMIQSWEKLLATNCRIFLPGHGQEISRKLLEKQHHKYAPKHQTKHAL